MQLKRGLQPALQARRCFPGHNQGCLERIQMSYACFQPLSMLQNPSCAAGVL